MLERKGKNAKNDAPDTKHTIVHIASMIKNDTMPYTHHCLASLDA